MGGLVAPGALGGGRWNETVDVREQGPCPRGSQRMRSAALSTSICDRLARGADTGVLCTQDALGTRPGNGGRMEDTKLWSLHPHMPVKGGKQGDPTRSTRSASVRGAQTAEGGAQKGYTLSLRHCCQEERSRKTECFWGHPPLGSGVLTWGTGQHG